MGMNGFYTFVEEGNDGELYRVKKVGYGGNFDFLKREYMVTKSLRGLEGVVQVVGDIEYDEDDFAFFRMGEVSGLTLEKVLKLSRTKDSDGRIVRNPLSLFIVRYLTELAYAVQGVHSKKVAHKDLKPNNLMMTPDFSPVILDFGLADVSDFVPIRHTVGTPAFMAPEQGKSYHNADQRSDIYALGCIIYHCLTGHQVFPGNSRKTMLRHVEDLPTNADVINPLLFPELNAIIMACLEKRPEDRPQTALELGDALRDIVREKLYIPM
jgi:eukaryotic-like serine/threonine-protein kinase